MLAEHVLLVLRHLLNGMERGLLYLLLSAFFALHTKLLTCLGAISSGGFRFLIIKHVLEHLLEELFDSVSFLFLLRLRASEHIQLVFLGLL